MRKHTLILLFVFLAAIAHAQQVADHRNDFAVGFSGGYSLTDMRFLPKVSQTMHGGFVLGVTGRYTCEKYYSSICALQAEVNLNQMGWKENIIDYNEDPVINQVTGLPEEYQRTITYVQVPMLARLGWGREKKGFQFFFQAGPQFGYCMSEKTKMNFKLSERNIEDRVNQTIAQDTMPVENKFDFGITAGIGLEYSHPKLGHFLLDVRYYYGLGNIYGDSKRDNFGTSNFRNIVVKLAYLFDIVRTKEKKKG